MMQEDFVRYATTDLNRPLREGSDVPEEVRWGGAGRGGAGLGGGGGLPT